MSDFDEYNSQVMERYSKVPAICLSSSDTIEVPESKQTYCDSYKVFMKEIMTGGISFVFTCDKLDSDIELFVDIDATLADVCKEILEQKNFNNFKDC